jgi:hypothetical protein
MTEKKFVETNALGTRSGSPAPQKIEAPLMKNAMSSKLALCARQSA